VTLLEGFQKPQWQPYRAGLFVGLGLWGIIPIGHSWLLSGGEVAVSQTLALELLMGAIYIVSFQLYNRWILFGASSSGAACLLAGSSPQPYACMQAMHACLPRRRRRMLITVATTAAASCAGGGCHLRHPLPRAPEARGL
jgi:adiponectin receptor